MNAADRVRALFEDSLAAHRAALETLAEPVAAAAARLGECLDAGGKILACGNGGSAADAQHFAAELIGRFERERAALPAVALSTDTSALTAIGNDYGFEAVFRRQVEGLGRPGDCLLAISTSGDSPNVLAAAAAARERGLGVVALTGRDGGKLAGALGAADMELRAPADSTARIQELHILLLHCLCDLLDRR